jgi:type VI secretion system protein ImpG
MRSDLLAYYETELSSLRRLGAEFAEKYPKIASRLVLEPNKCEDPHVERLLEAFAFLAARVHLKLDDEFPLITESLLEVLYPDFLRPIPSMSIAEFHLDSESSSVTTGVEVKRGTKLYSRPVNGVPCKFRTAYDLKLWPIRVTAAEWKSPVQLPQELRQPGCGGAIRIELRGPLGVPISQLGIGQLRLFLDGETTLVHTLYEMLFRDLQRVVIRGQNSAILSASAVVPVGFELDEGILDYSQRSFLGYRLLQEYFAFPEKFLFFTLAGCQKAWATAGAGEKAEIYFLISNSESSERRQHLELGLSARVFRLNCAPVVNLFEQTCEPILLDHHTYEYTVVPDARRPNAVEIYSIDDVVRTQPQSREIVHCQPFYSSRPQAETSHLSSGHFWMAYRRPSTRPQDAGTDIALSLVDSSGQAPGPSGDTLTVRTICTNRDLPSRLPFGNSQGDFELDGNVPVSRIVALRKPTNTLRPPGGPGSLWNLISHLSLNYLSLVDEGKSALQTLLRLSDYTRTAFSGQLVEGISNVRSKPHFAGLLSEHGMTFVRGTSIELELDEEKFVGGGVYLFSSVLERFFALYCSLNSFSQLTVRVRQRKEVLREWQPRAGQRILM